MPRSGARPGPARDPAFFGEKLEELWRDHSAAHSFVHGDAHIGNTYVTREGNGGLLDFQVFGAGNWAREFAYFTVGSISVDDRRNHLESLLDHYLEELRAHGGEPPTRDAAMLMVRRNLLNGLFSWVACPLDMQPLEVVKPTVERMATACDDLEAVSAFDE